MTTTSISNCEPATGGLHRSLLAEFDGAFRRMNDASDRLNVVFGDLQAGLSAEDAGPRMSAAARDYADRRDEFLATSAVLHRFMIDDIVSARSSLPPAFVAKRTFPKPARMTPDFLRRSA